MIDLPASFATIFDHIFCRQHIYVPNNNFSSIFGKCDRSFLHTEHRTRELVSDIEENNVDATKPADIRTLPIPFDPPVMRTTLPLTWFACEKSSWSVKVVISPDGSL